jgi:hypothetical protein
VSGVTQIDLKVGQLRRRLRRMPETELLRFGQAAKYKCSREANYGPPRDLFIVQLREARAEWRGRHPKLPLKESRVRLLQK